MNGEALAELADERGIEREFLDYKKDPVVIPLEHRAQILQLMGYAGDAWHAREALEELQDESWSRAVPPVAVADEGGPLTLTVHLPARCFNGPLWLDVHCDDGSEQRIEIPPRSARFDATRMHRGTSLERRDLKVEAELSAGYHEATLLGSDHEHLGRLRLYVLPGEAYCPRAIVDGERLGGVSVQLYTVRSGRNWGMGDFTDLATLIRECAAQGIDVVGVSPLHALLPANPLHFSPYSPSSRAFLNVMYIDPQAIPEYQQVTSLVADIGGETFQERLRALRNTHQVDYAGVADCKLRALEAIYAHFRDHELSRDSERASAFRAFVAEHGEPLRLHALYDCLHEHFLHQDMHCWGWPVWPEEFRDPAGDAVVEFAGEHADRLRYYMYLQWCAHEQLCAAQALAGALGMRVGIYLDLAVGVDMNGSEVWANQAAFALDASAGAPPDELARSGQDWGFPPICPRNLHDTGYDLFIRNLRANMSRCGAVRYDHAVSLLRLWWIPKTQTAAEGAYVRYPLDTLLGLLALESRRHRCLVIGEDLGTVPAVLTRRMEARLIFSYKVLYFEKSGDDFTAPADYPAAAAATITTHDLPTLASWWDGSDIDQRAELGLLGSDDVAGQMRESRAADRARLLRSLQMADCWSGSTDPAEFPEMTAELNAAVHAFLGRSRAALMITQVDDLMQMLTPINIPGTFQDHANWQRKLRYPLEGLFDRAAPAAICVAMREGRRQ